jgi:hypothetical protein
VPCFYDDRSGTKTPRKPNGDFTPLFLAGRNILSHPGVYMAAARLEDRSEMEEQGKMFQMNEMRMVAADRSANEGGPVGARLAKEAKTDSGFRQAVNRELEYAKDVQQALLPPESFSIPCLGCETPLDDSKVEEALRAYVYEVDNLSDREDQKLDRMRVRFSRVRAFLAYLLKEENNEQARFGLQEQGGIWAAPFIPAISDQIEREIAWIQRRVEQNREKYAEDIRIQLDDTESPEIILADSDEDDAASPSV